MDIQIYGTLPSNGGESGGAAGVGKLTMTYADNAYTLDAKSIAYLNTLTADNLPAAFLVKIQSGGQENYYMNYFSEVYFSDGGNSFAIYYYDVYQSRYTVLFLDQSSDSWDVTTQ